jgi:hypothetical protein
MGCEKSSALGGAVFTKYANWYAALYATVWAGVQISTVRLREVQV